MLRHGIAIDDCCVLRFFDYDGLDDDQNMVALAADDSMLDDDDDDDEMNLVNNLQNTFAERIKRLDNGCETPIKKVYERGIVRPTEGTLRTMDTLR